MKSKTIMFKFLNRDATALSHDNQIYTPMRPMVEHLGLSWPEQSEYLGEQFSKAVKILHTDSDPVGVICLELSALTGFLLFTPADTVKPALQESLMAFQDECDATLFNPEEKKNNRHFACLIGPLFITPRNETTTKHPGWQKIASFFSHRHRTTQHPLIDLGSDSISLAEAVEELRNVTALQSQNMTALQRQVMDQQNEIHNLNVVVLRNYKKHAKLIYQITEAMRLKNGNPVPVNRVTKPH